MAAATLTPGFTTVSTCDTNTGWSGTNTLDTEIFKQGTASLSGTLRTTGINQKYFTIASTNLANTHLRIWLNYASLGFLETKVNGGIRFMVYDGTNTGYWYMAGRDTYPGGWVLLTVSTAKAFDSGTANLGAITRVGFALNLTGAPRNAVNTWWDYLVYGSGITITGGNTTDAVTWSTIYDADVAGGFGAVQRVNGVYAVNTALNFGSTNNIYFEDSNQIVVFEDQPVDTHLYHLDAIGTGTTSFKFTNSVLKSVSTNTRYDLGLASTQLDTLTFSGNTIVNADMPEFKSGFTIEGCVFQGCNQITAGGASFINNIIRNSTDTNGALLWPGGTSVQDCTFDSNSAAIAFSTGTTSESWIGLLLSNNLYDAKNNNTTATADSYALANQNVGFLLGGSYETALGQSFTGNGGKLAIAGFYINKSGTPTGNATAKLYAHTGTFGTSSLPTGTPIATSNPINVTSLGAWATVNFTFSTAPTITAATNYCIVVDFAGGDASNYLSVGADSTTPSHGGNKISWSGGAWAFDSAYDVIFYVYTGGILVQISGNGTAAGLTYTGLPVGFEASATLTLKNVKDGSEVRIYKTGTTEQLYGLESKDTGVDPSYSYTTSQNVDIVIHSLPYQYYRLNNYSLPTADTDLPVSQITDRNYKNPA